MMKRIILILLFASLAGTSHAQEKRELVPPDFKDTIVTYTFIAPELQVDSAFIDSLNNIVLFGKRGPGIPADDSWRNFHLTFKEKDSLNYSFQVLLEQDGGLNSKGFFEYDGYMYWFRGDVPPGIILKTTELKKQFSYDEIITAIADVYDPSVWFLTYNRQTGKMEDNEWPFFD